MAGSEEEEPELPDLGMHPGTKTSAATRTAVVIFDIPASFREVIRYAAVHTSDNLGAIRRGFAPAIDSAREPRLRSPISSS